MKYVWRLLALGALLGLFVAPASAQYVYLDTNGDGVHTSGDLLQPNGTPTTVNVYINTNHNRDGSLAVCNTADGDLGFWNSYAVNLRAAGGTVTYSNFVNQQPTFNLTCVGVGIDFLSSGDEMTACRATATSAAGALQQMFTVTVTGQSGTPSLQVIPLGSLSPNFTSFGTPCSASDFDNTYKLGADFMDADGAGPAPGGNASPVLSVPSTAFAIEGDFITITATATDADADALTITATGAPSSLTLTTTPGTSSVTATLSGTLGMNDRGNYSIVWSVSDGVNPPITAATVLTVSNLDQPPVVNAPANVSAVVGIPIAVIITVTEPDGDIITALTTDDPLPAGATFTTNSGHNSGTLEWTPAAGQEGEFDMVFTATANGVSGSASTHFSVSGSGADVPPSVTAPALMTGSEGTLLTFTVSALDGNGDAITSLTASPLPAGATFNTNASYTSGTFAWTPDGTQAGAYDVVFTASNALSGSATTHLTIGEQGQDQAPLVTAPATVTGTEGAAVSFVVTALDSDGDLITLLTAAPLPPGATFTANAANTSGTFAWTPSSTQAGVYDVVFTASNALSGSATTHLTIGEQAEDQAPVVTAPATVNGTEGLEVSFVVTAFDADGDVISSLTAAALPSGATFNTNAANTSGTFTWTPTGTQAGAYDVTFTAVNALSGSASTHITIGEGGTGGDRPPIVCAPRCIASRVGRIFSFRVTASDPDGDVISSLTASTLPAGATFTTNDAHTSGTFRWTPTAGQEGTYDVTFTAANALSGNAVTHIKIREPDQSVVLDEIADVTVAEGATVTVPVHATDADNDTIRLSACLPAFATLNQPRMGVGEVSTTLMIAPQTGDAGTYNVFVRARGKSGDCEIERFRITVTPAGGGVNVPPTITVDATATVNEGQFLSVTVTTSDANGDEVSLSASGLPGGASFHDNGDGTGTLTWTPNASQSGTYSVTFTANDHHGGTATATLAITVNDVAGAVAANVFTTGLNNVARLGQEFCVNIEPVDGSFATGDVNVSAITLSYLGNTVTAASGDVSADVDANHNDVMEVEACFSADQLLTLFGSLPVGENTVSVTVAGTLAGGGTFSGSMDQRVVVAGHIAAKGHGPMQVTARPNPLNPRTELSFRTTRPGAVRVDLFDARGQLVRSLVAQSLSAGPHAVPWDGTNDRGVRVASGAYFFRIQAPDGRQVQRITVVK